MTYAPQVNFVPKQGVGYPVKWFWEIKVLGNNPFVLIINIEKIETNLTYVGLNSAHVGDNWLNKPPEFTST